MKTKFVCPECEALLQFDYGDCGSRWEPPEPAAFYCDNCGWCDNNPPKRAGWINDIFDLLEVVYGQVVEHNYTQAEKLLQQLVYLKTKCGCYVVIEDVWGISIVGYAEGADAGCVPQYMEFPFTANEWNLAVASADIDGCELWHEWNKEE